MMDGNSSVTPLREKELKVSYERMYSKRKRILVSFDANHQVERSSTSGHREKCPNRYFLPSDSTKREVD